MLRLIFFLLLILNVAVGAYFYLKPAGTNADVPVEVNREKLKIISVADAGKAQQEAQIVLAARKLAETLSGSACVEFGVKPNDGARAQSIFASMQLGERLASRNAEEFTRFAVGLTSQKDKKIADTLVANLKKAGVKDVSALADNSISLGVFSSEEAAKRSVAELETKAAALVKGITITPRNAQVKETIFTVKEPDTSMIARLSLMQRDFESSTVKAVACPIAPVPTSVAAEPAKQ